MRHKLLLRCGGARSLHGYPRRRATHRNTQCTEGEVAMFKQRAACLPAGPRPTVVAACASKSIYSAVNAKYRCVTKLVLRPACLQRQPQLIARAQHGRDAHQCAGSSVLRGGGQQPVQGQLLHRPRPEGRLHFLSRGCAAGVGLCVGAPCAPPPLGLARVTSPPTRRRQSVPPRPSVSNTGYRLAERLVVRAARNARAHARWALSAKAARTDGPALCWPAPAFALAHRRVR